MDKEYLNILYDASLEFGENWRRPIKELAMERLPKLREHELSEICLYIEKVRVEIEKLVYDSYGKIMQETMNKEEIIDTIRQRYSWMNEENISHGFSQGMYYAWHG